MKRRSELICVIQDPCATRGQMLFPVKENYSCLVIIVFVGYQVIQKAHKLCGCQVLDPECVLFISVFDVHFELVKEQFFLKILDIKDRRKIGLWFSGIIWSLLGSGIMMTMVFFHVLEKYEFLRQAVNIFASSTIAVLSKCLSAVLITLSQPVLSLVGAFLLFPIRL